MKRRTNNKLNGAGEGENDAEGGKTTAVKLVNGRVKPVRTDVLGLTGFDRFRSFGASQNIEENN